MNVADQQRSRLPLVVGVVMVMAAIAAGGFLYFTRDTSDAPLTLDDAPEASGESVDIAALDGSWAVVPGGADATVAGYRVEEVFAAGAREATANGRTSDVTGTLAVAEGSVTEGSFTVDLTTLASDEAQRDNALKGRGLETDAFPRATFALTQPIELPTLADGEAFEVSATGDLTLHGVTKGITIDLTGRAAGDTFTVQGAAPVAFADYEIEPPSNSFVEVEDTGSLEFVVNFEQT